MTEDFNIFRCSVCVKCGITHVCYNNSIVSRFNAISKCFNMTIFNIHVHSIVYTGFFPNHIESNQTSCRFIQINHNQSNIFINSNVKINIGIFLGDFCYSKCHFGAVHIVVIITEVSYINIVAVCRECGCQYCNTI